MHPEPDQEAAERDEDGGPGEVADGQAGRPAHPGNRSSMDVAPGRPGYVRKIFRLMVERKLNQKAVAEQLGISRTFLLRWRQAGNSSEPTFGQAIQLARILGVSLDWLVDDSQDELPPTPAALLRLRDVSDALARLADEVRAVRAEAARVGHEGRSLAGTADSILAEVAALRPAPGTTVVATPLDEDEPGPPPPGRKPGRLGFEDPSPPMNRRVGNGGE